MPALCVVCSGVLNICQRYVLCVQVSWIYASVMCCVFRCPEYMPALCVVCSGVPNICQRYVP